MVEMLTSVLSGGAVAGEMLPPPGHTQDENNPVSHVVLAIDLRSFGDPEEIIRRNEALIDYLHGFETRSPDIPMLYPGELEGISIEKAKKEGIQVPENIVEYLRSKAAEIGLPFPSSDFHET